MRRIIAAACLLAAATHAHAEPVAFGNGASAHGAPINASGEWLFTVVRPDDVAHLELLVPEGLVSQYLEHDEFYVQMEDWNSSNPLPSVWQDDVATDAAGAIQLESRHQWAALYVEAGRIEVNASSAPLTFQADRTDSCRQASVHRLGTKS